MRNFDTEDFDLEENHLRYKSGKDRRPLQKRKRASARVLAELIEHDDKYGAVAMGAGTGFMPTFHSSHHERSWIIESLGGFYENNQILDVLRQVKGGKEANVYCCAANPKVGAQLLAAKVYRPRMFRNLSNDAIYREGSSLVDDQGKAIVKTRDLRAVARKTGFGQQVLHGSWLYNEYRTLQVLHEAGVLVPKPYALGSNSILMEYLGDLGVPAPSLDQVTLSSTEARPLFEQLIECVRLMLAHDRVHADLSAYNVLYWEGQVKIIDFPQAVDPLFNPNAFTFFARDVMRLCQYFARYGINTNPAGLAAKLWATHLPGESSEILQDLPIAAYLRTASG